MLPGHRRTVVRTGELKVNGELRSVFLFDDVAVIAKKQKKKLPYSFVLSIPMDACTLGNDEKLGFIITSGKKCVVRGARPSGWSRWWWWCNYSQAHTLPACMCVR